MIVNVIEPLSFPSLALQPNLKEPRASAGTIHSSSPVPSLLSVNFSPLPPPQLNEIGSLSGSTALIKIANLCPGFAPLMSATPAITGALFAVGCGVGLGVDRAVCDGLGLGVDCNGDDGLGAGVGAGVAGAVGIGVGAIVGAVVGASVGLNIGAAVGEGVGLDVSAAVGEGVGLDGAAVGVDAIVRSSSGTGLIKRVRSGVGALVATVVGTGDGVRAVDAAMMGSLPADSTRGAGCVVRAASGLATPASDSGAAAGAAHAASAAIKSGTATNRNLWTPFINEG